MTDNSEKYNVIMPQTTDKVLCIQIEKVISSEGYAENFLPRIKEMYQKHGEIRILLYYKNFLGWEPDAAKQDMFASADFGSKIPKIAFVNPPESEIFHRMMKKEFFAGEMKFFNENELDDALEWVAC